MQSTLFFAAGRMFAATRTGQMPVTLVASLPAGSVLRAQWWEAEVLSFHQRSQGKKSKERKEEIFTVVEKPGCWLSSA